jgi:hypothetical protein
MSIRPRLCLTAIHPAASFREIASQWRFAKLAKTCRSVPEDGNPGILVPVQDIEKRRPAASFIAAFCLFMQGLT